MDKKVIIAIVAIVAVVAIVIGIVVLTGGQQPGGFGKQEINLQELNTNISAMEPYSLMSMQDIDVNILAASYNITQDEYDEAVGKMPMINVQASMYLVIKAKEGSVDSVKAKVEEYGQTQERIWSTYLPEQYELVKQRKIGTVGNIVYLIIGESATDVEALINK